MSTQWGAQGYFYPIQIAQYGLSHYSKFLMEDSPKTTVVEDGEDSTVLKWTVDGDGSVKNDFDMETKSRVIEFHASGSSQWII